MITGFDRVVANMVNKFGTTAYVSVAVSEVYDPLTSENVVTYQDYPVNAMLFDYVRKNEGEGEAQNTLIRTGDKQVYIQPPQKTDIGLALPHLSANRDFFKINDKIYKIVTVKQLNPSQQQVNCILYELYIRE
jgi:hypothetical protein